MSMRLEDCPEWQGPGSEDFGAEPEPAYPAPARPAQDPALAAIEATLRAERAADRFKSTPPDALEIS